MAQQTSLEIIQEQIDFEIRKIEIYLANGIEYPIRFMYKSLKLIKGKAELAKEMHKTDCINFSIEWENRRDEEEIKDKKDLYDAIYKQQ